MRTFICLFIFCYWAQCASAQCNATITPLGSTALCQGGSVTLQASPGNVYKWFLNGNYIALLVTDTFTVSAGGNYVVVVDSAGCIDTSEVTIVATGPPAQPGLISGQDTFCSGTTQTFSVDVVPMATSYSWLSDGSDWQSFSGTTTTPHHTGVVGCANDTMPAIVSVTATNACGQSQPSTKSTAPFSPPIVEDINNVIVCPGSPLPIYPTIFQGSCSFSSQLSYQWLHNGIQIPGATNQQLSIKKGGDYAVNVITQFCGTTTISKHVNERNYRITSPIHEQTMCIDGAAMLTCTIDSSLFGGTYSSWMWMLNGGTIAGTENLKNYLATEPGLYRVQIFGYYNNSGLCLSFSDSVIVTQTATLAQQPFTITGYEHTATATPSFSSYQWYNNGIAIEGANSSTLIMNHPGLHYFVTARDFNGCLVKSNSTFVSVKNTTPFDDSFVISPNPTSGTFNLKANISTDKEATITITDITGRTITSGNILVANGVIDEQITLDKNTAPGIYFLRLTSENYNKVSSFVKQ